MGDYSHDMKDEKKPASVLPEGLRLIRVTEMIAGTSKAGNSQFVTTIEDVKTKKIMQVWLVAEPKKRWLLKSLLGAVGVSAAEDGVYDWSVTDVIGKYAMAMVEHYTEPWINREGKEVMLDKCKVSEFRESEHESGGVVNEEDIAWKE